MGGVGGPSGRGAAGCATGTAAGDGAATLIALVRHGETAWTETGRVQGYNDVPLSPAGLGQAEALGCRLAGQKWDALYTSPLSRARQTAAAIGAHTGLQPVVEAGLIERDMGALSGLTADELRARFTPESPIPGLESRADVERRAFLALAAIARRHPGGRVVAVSHGALINAVLRAIGSASATDAALPTQVRVATGSVNLVECRGDAVTLVAAAGAC